MRPSLPTPPCRRVKARAVPGDPEDRIMSLSGLRQSLDELAAIRFDVVHIHTPFIAHYAGLKFARRLKIPVVATYHTLFEEYLHHYVPLLSRKITGGLARRFSRSQCNQVDAVIAPSLAAFPRRASPRATVPPFGAATDLRRSAPMRCC